MIVNKTLNKQKWYAIIAKSQATLSEIVAKGSDKNRSKEMILQPKR